MFSGSVSGDNQSNQNVIQVRGLILNLLAIPAFERQLRALTLIPYYYTLTVVVLTLTDIPLWWRTLTWSPYELAASGSTCVLSL